MLPQERRRPGGVWSGEGGVRGRGRVRWVSGQAQTEDSQRPGRAGGTLSAITPDEEKVLEDLAKCLKKPDYTNSIVDSIVHTHLGMLLW